MDVAQPVVASASAVSFSHLSSGDITGISVKQIVNVTLFDNLNRPTAGGLYDPALGPLKHGSVCSTCSMAYADCPGHFGHIDLPAPVYHPLYMTQLFNLLRGSCHYCHRFLLPKFQITKYVAQLLLLERGLPQAAAQVESMHYTEPSKKKKGKGKKKADESDDDEEDDDDEMHDGQAEAAQQKLYEFMISAINDAQAQQAEPISRDDYKDSACFAKRKAVIAEFLKTIVSKKRCTACGAHAHRLRKDGHTRILEYSLTPKQQGYHDLLSIKRKDAGVLETLAGQTMSAAPVHADVLERQRLKREKEALKQQESTSSSESDASDSEASSSSSVRQNGNASSEESEQETSEDESGEDITGEDPGIVRKQAKSKANGKVKQTERVLTPNECRAHIRLLFQNEVTIVSAIYGRHGPTASNLLRRTERLGRELPKVDPDMFFCEKVVVPPNRFRPAGMMNDLLIEHPQNELLGNVLRTAFRVRDLNEALSASSTKKASKELAAKPDPSKDPLKIYGQLLESLIQLQVSVNSLMDSTKNPTPMRQGKEPPQGVKQVLEKKEGLFRMNMMGKRVNYAARSVISPDINIETNEIGVPPVFAKKLTYPEPVTPHNVHKMMELVKNGPRRHPGAAFIQMEDGHLVSLDKMSDEQLIAQANQLLTETANTGTGGEAEVGLPRTKTQPVNRKVYRHLDDGDILILNRQPTLHKPSMMCHKAKVLKGEKTIRMHYANCNSYNADFDGDEMNMHFPQTQIAQAEARYLANTDSQYLVPTSGNPLRGLIQDHIVAGVWMTSKDSFFTRSEYFQLIYGALRPENYYSGGGSVLTVPPAVLKPQPMWTGKQIISTILKNIQPHNSKGLNLASKSKVPGNAWGIHTEENSVLFMDGDLLTGILDKSQFGASAYGMVHSVFEIYGADSAGKLLGILSRLFTKYLQHNAFSCRMDDLLLTEEGNKWREDLIKSASERGLNAALDVVGMKDANPDQSETMQNLRTRLEEVLRDDSKLAGLDAFVSSAANDLTSKVIEKCLPNGLVKPFPHNNMQTMTVSGAKGSNVNASQISCMLGQQALEGRRVPTMVSGKTLPSFRAFETAPRAGGYVAGRFLTGIRPQEYYFHCMAGREGLIDTAVKTSRSGYLQRCLIKHLEGIKVHYDHTVRNSDSTIIQFHYGEDSLDVTKQKHLYQFEFATRNHESLTQRYRPKDAANRVDEEKATAHMAQALKHPETTPPTLSVYSPSTHFAATSEKYAQAVNSYIKANPQRLLKSKKKQRENWPEFAKKADLLHLEQFKALMSIKYIKSLVDPGEAVGLLASQGVGEPSTQMTLNTFHFAGHGAANVTLGIPRLREIVMTASADIKTPTMKLPILDGITEAQLEKFCKNASKTTLSQVVEEVTVEERLSAKTEKNGFSRQKLYTVKMRFYPASEYQEQYNITSDQILTCIHRSFSPKLDREITKEMKSAAKGAKLSQVGRAGKTKAAANEDDAVDEDMGAVNTMEEEEVDGDADDAKRKAKSQQQTTYDSDEGDSDSDVDLDAMMEDEKAQKASSEAAESSDSEDDNSDSPATVKMTPKSGKAAKKARMEKLVAIEQDIAHDSKFIDSAEFDKEKGEWCNLQLEFSSDEPKLLLVGIIERACRQAVIHQAPGISRCLVAAPDKKDPQAYCITEGVNLAGCWTFAEGIVDMNRIYSNDIAAVRRVYGVEAARRVLIKEVSGIFEMYGIAVDPRHLTLIADYMTNEGGYKPFNRTGLQTSPSPFLKASFETTATFISDAALYGDFEDMASPSAAIVMGQTPQTGSGAFAITVPCNMVEVSA